MPPLILPQMEVHQTPGKETQWAFAGLLHHQNCSAITKVLMPSCKTQNGQSVYIIHLTSLHGLRPV